MQNDDEKEPDEESLGLRGTLFMLLRFRTVYQGHHGLEELPEDIMIQVPISISQLSLPPWQFFVVAAFVIQTTFLTDVFLSHHSI